MLKNYKKQMKKMINKNQQIVNKSIIKMKL